MSTLKCLLLYKFKIILLLLITASTPRSLASSRPSLAGGVAASTTLLTNYDRLISSSPLGEPVFRLQPPNVIEYSNTQGTTLVCLASGSPKPTIEWFTSPLGIDTSQLSNLSGGGDNNSQDIVQTNSRPVTNITNLRIILQDGAALRLLPFQAGEFLQDVHTAEYRCVASNPIATIHSKSVSVQAVIQPPKRPAPSPGDLPPKAATVASNAGDLQMDFIRVSDEFVQLKAPAVLKCKLASSSTSLASRDHLAAQPLWFVEQPAVDYLEDPNDKSQTIGTKLRRREYTIEWFTSDGLQIRPTTDWPLLAEGETAHFTAFDTGELHLASVEMADLRRTYGCRVRARANRRADNTIGQSNMAQLILIDSDQAKGAGSHEQQQQTLVQVLHSLDQVVVIDSDWDYQLDNGGFDSSGSDNYHHRHETKAAFLHRSTTGVPHYASTPGTRTRILQSQSEVSPVLLLPCAVRVPAIVSTSQMGTAKGRWLYQAPKAWTTAGDSSGNQRALRPIGLEQLVSTHRKWLHLVDRSANQAKINHSAMPTSGSGGGSKLMIGATFLAIERPRKQLSGRYQYQLLFDGQNEQNSARTVCDINVIVSEPLRLQMAMGSQLAEVSDKQTHVMSALTSGQKEEEEPTIWRSLKQWFTGSELPRTGPATRHRRTAQTRQDYSRPGEDIDLHNDPSRIRVTGTGSVPQMSIVRVGERLELACLAQGHPIDSIRWFRQGRAIDTQSSSDFQTEISTSLLPSPVDNDNLTSTTGGPIVSRLLIRQLQVRELGLQMFECFAQNSLGDRARASKAVLVLDREQVSEARAKCPLDNSQPLVLDDNGHQLESTANDESTTTLVGLGLTGREPASALAVFQEHNPFKLALALEGEPIELNCPLNMGNSNALEQPQIEWLKWAPQAIHQQRHHHSSEDENADRAASLKDKQQQQFTTSDIQSDQQRTRQLDLARHFNQLFGGESRFLINGSSLQIRSPSKRHDQTLFVCIRRQRHQSLQQAIDGAAAAAAAASNKQAADSSGQRAHNLQHEADFGLDYATAASLGRQRHQHHHSVHQSSLATPALPLLESPSGWDSDDAADYQGAPQGCIESLFSLAATATAVAAGEQQGAASAHHDRQGTSTTRTAAAAAAVAQGQHHQQSAVASMSIGAAAPASPLVSSISIRIVAKPKIDPFEFSRDLEEGMRTVVVCTVVSVQSLVSINWFKDGKLLISGDKENDGLKIEPANGFSSTLTFHKIRPSHSGYYTCVVSNAFASTEHTSRLLVNVAPYFLEPPRSQRAYLNSNVLINCRAGGQPAPQIRWRKLVPVGGATGGEQKFINGSPLVPSAPPGGSGSQQSSKLTQAADSSSSSSYYHSGDIGSISAQKMALPANILGADQPQNQPQSKYEFRIITSNSHIQVLENGSMIIKEVELGDAARYSCQASNGVQPVLSEVIRLDVLTPAQFNVNYEKVSVKRDSLVRFNCAPSGDQPMQVDWFMDGRQLVRSSVSSSPPSSSSSSSSVNELGPVSALKYSELIQFVSDPIKEETDHLTHIMNSSQSISGPLGAGSSMPARHFKLTLADEGDRAQAALGRQTRPEVGDGTVNSSGSNLSKLAGAKTQVTTDHLGPVIRSELIIESATRSDSGLFVCVARNTHGQDELSYRLLVQEPPDAPLNLQVQSIQSTSLKLLWQTPFDGHTPISYYVVEYRKLPVPLSSLAQAEPPRTTSNLAQSNLQQQHQVWSRVIVSQSGQQDAQLTELRASPGPLISATGATSHLVVHSPQPVANEPNGAIVAKLNSVTLKQLVPMSAYQIRLAAVNPIGQGSFSPIQLINTAEEAPQTRPADLRAQAISSAALKLMWRGPLAQPHDSAPVRGYYVSHRRHSSPTNDGHPTTVPKSGEPASGNGGWLATISLSASNYSSTIDDNLLPVSLPSAMQLDQQQPHVSPAISVSQLVNYELQLSSLERNAKYDVLVQPFNLMGVGPSAELTVQTLKFDRPGQPSVRLVAARKQSLELMWSVASSSHLASSPALNNNINPTSGPTTSIQSNQVGGELQGFSLYYKCEYDDWREISLTVIYRYVIDNLRCGNKYQIYLSAYNSIGRSDPSDVLSVRTEGSVPQAPVDRNSFIRLNITEVILDMASWSSGGCPISSFMIQFKRLHDSNWYILSEGATPFTQTDKITIPDLVPATWYKLMVNALNEAGSTNAEYIFATLTLDGQQLSPPDYLLDQQQPLKPNKSTGGLGGGLWAALSLFLSGGGGGGRDSGRNQDSPLLLPVSCILLLTVASLASYLYYTKHVDARKTGHKARQNQPSHHHQQQQQQQQPCNGKLVKQYGQHTANNNHLAHAGGGNLQMLDRHLLGASHSCLSGLPVGGVTTDSTSSSGSSSSAIHHQQGATNNHRHLNRTMTLHRTHRPNGHVQLDLHHHHHHQQQQQHQQLDKEQFLQSHLPGATISTKSQVILSQSHHDNYLISQQQQVRSLLNQSSPPPPPPPTDLMHQTGNNAGQLADVGDTNHLLTNYVLDTFLNQQQGVSSSSSSGQSAAIGSSSASQQQQQQQTSFVCNQPGACRAATMKLYTGGARGPSSNSYFDCGGSSSLSSSGLGGSAHTTTSNHQNQGNQLHLIGECHSSQPSPPAPLISYEISGLMGHEQMADGSRPACHYDTQQQRQQRQHGHVDLVQQREDEETAAVVAAAAAAAAAANEQQQNQQRLLASSSFASAADLIQRQQQQQQSEPIYQRLDRFKTCALPACVRQFATMNPAFSSRFKQQYEQQHSLDDQTMAMSSDQHASDTHQGASCFYPPPFVEDFNHEQSADQRSGPYEMSRRHNERQQQHHEANCGDSVNQC